MTINVSSHKKDNENAENNYLINPFAKVQVNDSSESSSKKLLIDLPETNDDIVFKESDYIVAPQRPTLITEASSFQNIVDPAQFVVEKSLKTSVIFESDISLSFLKNKLMDPIYLMQKMKDPTSDTLSFYYRYPDSTLPSNQKKNIHKALSSNVTKMNKNDENLSWYKMFSEKWRKALLSAYETLKYGSINYFYFVQENLTVLFERDTHDFTLKACMQLTSLALGEDLKNNGKVMRTLIFTLFLGIEFKIISRKNSNSLSSDGNNDSHSEAEAINEAEEYGIYENSEGPIIQLKRSKTYFLKEDIMIEGSLALAELVDFLINQKDRNSYAILPEIYSPGPFINGTLRNNFVTFSGACKDSAGKLSYQLKINGVIFPHSTCYLLRELRESGHKISLIVEREISTDFLSAFPYVP